MNLLALPDRTLRLMADDPSPEQIAHVAALVVERMNAMGFSAHDIYKNKGPSPGTVKNLIERHQWIRRADARRGLALALRLRADGIDAWARGEEAVELDGPTAAEEITRLAEIQAGQSAAIDQLRAQQEAFELEFRGRLQGLEGLLQQIAAAVESQRASRRRGGAPPSAPPTS